MEQTAASQQLSLSKILFKAGNKYFGIALTLAWNYCLWFSPSTFINSPLLGETITYSWLVNLGAASFFFFIIPILLGRKNQLFKLRWLCWFAPIVGACSTALLTLVPLCLQIPVIAYSLASLVGASNAVMWILWGERYACLKSTFDVVHVAGTVGATLLVCIGITTLLPGVLAPLFVVALPILSGILYNFFITSDPEAKVPPLLPKSTTRAALKNVVVVCIIAFTTSLTCYYLAAIIPWEVLPGTTYCFTIGVIVACVLLLGVALICYLAREKVSIFSVVPWLLILTVVALCLYIGMSSVYFASFCLSLAISSSIELLLIMYFGILTSKGYIPPAMAFGFSGGFIRSGIAVGNTLAIVYEHNTALFEQVGVDTALVLVCIIALLIMPLTRQEYRIISLTSETPQGTDLEKTCREIGEENQLSRRETEILTLIAHGYTTEGIAKRLVISPYTVNTHIRHIYDKMNIHKRSELLNYINGQRSDF